MEINTIAHPDGSIVLSADELTRLTELLPQLENIAAQCEMVFQGNNISDIQRFSNTLAQREQQFPIAIVHEFVTDLNASIESFDITAINRLLNYYPQLIKQLEKIETKGH